MPDENYALLLSYLYAFIDISFPAKRSINTRHKTLQNQFSSCNNRTHVQLLVKVHVNHKLYVLSADENYANAAHAD